MIMHARRVGPLPRTLDTPPLQLPPPLQLDPLNLEPPPFQLRIDLPTLLTRERPSRPTRWRQLHHLPQPGPPQKIRVQAPRQLLRLRLFLRSRLRDLAMLQRSNTPRSTLRPDRKDRPPQHHASSIGTPIQTLRRSPRDRSWRAR